MSLEKTFLLPKLYSKSEISMFSMLFTVLFSVCLEETSNFKNKGLTEWIDTCSWLSVVNELKILPEICPTEDIEPIETCPKVISKPVKKRIDTCAIIENADMIISILVLFWVKFTFCVI